MVQQINFSASPILQNAISNGEIKVFEVTPDNNLVVAPAIAQDGFATSAKAQEVDNSKLLLGAGAVALGTLTALLIASPFIKNKSEALKGLTGTLLKENTFSQNAKELFVKVANEVEQIEVAIKKFSMACFAKLKEALDNLAEKGKETLAGLKNKVDSKPVEKTADDVLDIADDVKAVADDVAETATKA